MMSLSRMVEQ